MANLTETATYDAAVPELGISTPVVGGAGGMMNSQAQALANRTKYLKAERDKETSAGRALVEAADAAAQRTALGLGGSAIKNVGTSSDTVAAGDAPEAARASAVSTAAADATSKANAAATAAESYADGKDAAHLSAFTHGNIPSATGKANADGATATPTAAKVPIADASGLLDSWISDASTTKKGKVLLPNASGFAPMPLDAGVTIGPNTTGLTVGQKGPYRSDAAFTLPAGGTWEYDVDKVAFPVAPAAAPITSISFTTSLFIKYLGADYYAVIAPNKGLTIYQWTGKTLSLVASYAIATAGIAVLASWNGSTARLVTLYGTGANCTALVLVFNGTTLTLESTNSLPVGFLYYYIAVAALSATRIACINGNGSTTGNDDLLYVFDYDTTAKTWAQVGTAYPVPVYYSTGLTTLSTTDVVVITGTNGNNNTVIRLTFNGSVWSQVGVGYNLYNNHSFNGIGGIELYKNETILVSSMFNTIPQKLIALQWDILNQKWIPVSPVMQRVASETNQSIFGYGNGLLFWVEITNSTIYPYIFPAGSLSTNYSGAAAGGTTLCNAVLGNSFLGSVKRIQ